MIISLNVGSPYSILSCGISPFDDSLWIEIKDLSMKEAASMFLDKDKTKLINHNDASFSGYTDLTTLMIRKNITTVSLRKEPENNE